MDLTRHNPGDHYFIRSFSKEGIVVKDELHRESLVLSAETLLPAWPVRSMAELEEKHLQPLIDLEPEVAILGTGMKQAFLHPQLVMKFYEKGIGFEAMTSEAACRTFNVLVSENRRVAAALILER